MTSIKDKIVCYFSPKWTTVKTSSVMITYSSIRLGKTSASGVVKFQSNRLGEKRCLLVSFVKEEVIDYDLAVSMIKQLS